MYSGVFAGHKPDEILVEPRPTLAMLPVSVRMLGEAACVIDQSFVKEHV